MTGRDLILYILKYHHEDDDVLDFLMDVNRAAKKFGVGPETVKVWYRLELIPGIIIGDILLVPIDAENPREVQK